MYNLYYAIFFQDKKIKFSDFLMACDFKELEPEEYIGFKNKIIIKKADARKYEQDLKEELSIWIARGQKDKVITMKHYFV